jgi:hypothetical protein
MTWHQDPDDWHGPITHQEPKQVYDMRRGTVPMIVQYRECGCVTWKELGK